MWKRFARPADYLRLSTTAAAGSVKAPETRKKLAPVEGRGSPAELFRYRRLQTRRHGGVAWVGSFAAPIPIDAHNLTPLRSSRA